jgi:hypothetical protein
MTAAEQRLVDLCSARGLDLPQTARAFILNCIAGNMPTARLERLLQEHHPDIYRKFPDNVTHKTISKDLSKFVPDVQTLRPKLHRLGYKP